MTSKRKQKETAKGRRPGGHNRGYWFRKGRGWYPTWGKGTRRIAVQGLKRALNFAVSMQLTPRNPIKGYKVPVGGKWVTFFTPEIEKEMLQNAFEALRTAIQVCIRTGARYGSEFITLTAAHITAIS